jgi:glycosyltransferase involved in cell wall biosynthesis
MESNPAARPSVSVLMRVYDALPFLIDAIESILLQSFDDFELLIVDNGSTDGSLEYARSVCDHRVRVITETTRGLAAATNTGLAESRAELIAIMDADDVAHRQMLQMEVDFMRAHPDIVLMGVRSAFLVGSELVHVPPQPREHVEIRRALLQGLPVIHNGASMFRARVAKMLGGHRLEGPGHDLDFFLRMSEAGKVYNLPDLLYYYRQHDERISASSNPEIMYSQAFAVACAKARIRGLAEPDQETFGRRWKERPFIFRLSDHARRRSLGMYRLAVLKRGQKKHLSSVAALICSAALSPDKVIRRLKRNLGRW